MKILEALKKGFGIAGDNLKLVLIVFIFNLIWNWGIIPFAAPQTPAGPGANTAMSPLLTILSFVFLLASIFVQGGVLASLKDVLKDGKAELTKFAAYGAKFYLRLLALASIIILIIGVIAFIATLIMALSAPTKNAVIITITTIVALVIGGLGIYLVILLFFSPYILIVEETRVFQAVRISIEFTRRLILKVVGLGSLLILIGFGTGLFMAFLSAILSPIIGGRPLEFIIGFLNSGINAYLSIIVASCLVVYYSAMKNGEAQKKVLPA